MAEIKLTTQYINHLIKLLEIDGINSKKIVKDKLKELIEWQKT